MRQHLSLLALACVLAFMGFFAVTTDHPRNVLAGSCDPFVLQAESPTRQVSVWEYGYDRYIGINFRVDLYENYCADLYPEDNIWTSNGDNFGSATMSMAWSDSYIYPASLETGSVPSMCQNQDICILTYGVNDDDNPWNDIYIENWVPSTNSTYEYTNWWSPTTAQSTICWAMFRNQSVTCWD